MQTLRSELRLLGAAARALSFRPIVKPPEVAGEVRFSPATAEYQQLVVALVLLLAIETPLVHLVLGMMDAGAWRSWVRAGLLLGSVYLIIWLVGDLRLLRESPGVTVGRNIRVELGQRARGEVAMADVAAVKPLSGLDSEPADSAGGAERIIRITARPDPNVRVVLKRPVSMVGPFGIRRSGAWLDIHVDDPQALASAIRWRVARVEPVSPD